MFDRITKMGYTIKSVGGNFICSSNKLTSLEHAPKSVGGNFYCDDNNLTSLKGAPLKIGRDVDFEIRLSDHEDKHYYGNRYNLKINEMRIKDIFDSIEEIILKETKNKIKFIF